MLVDHATGPALLDFAFRGIILRMMRRLFLRCFAVLGMISMLGSLVVVPIVSHSAVAKAGVVNAAPSSAMGMAAMSDMPCHKATYKATKSDSSTNSSNAAKPDQPCPDCPQNTCPDMASCLVKCFQATPLVMTEGVALQTLETPRVAPAPSQVTAGSLIPPLLRPPSV